jgi:lysyl-tRNA synthetase class 1
MHPQLTNVADERLTEIDSVLEPIDPQIVAGSVREACLKLCKGSLNESEHNWLIDEYLPLQLVAESSPNNDPWDSYFCPIGSVTNSGIVTYFPDPFKTNVTAVEGWKKHARSLTHPVLKARYADVVWELAGRVTDAKKREIEFAKSAVLAYLETVFRNLSHDKFARFTHLKRGFSLAASIKMLPEEKEFKRMILEEHANAHKDLSKGFVFTAYDFLTSNKTTHLSDAEHTNLIADLETALTKYSNQESELFNPHFTSMVGKRLKDYYSKKKLPQEVIRIQVSEAQTFETAATKARALLASSFLRDALEKYKEAKLHDEAERIRIQLEDSITASHAEMAIYSHSTTITEEERLNFEKQLVSANPLITMQRIAAEFLPRVKTLTEHIERMTLEAPIFSMISQQIISDNQVVAIVGSAKDDLQGRLILAAAQEIQLANTWLKWGMDAAIKHHALQPADFVECVNRTGLFNDQRTDLLLEGFKAWYGDDQIKAIHILVPQVEHALRSLVRGLGHATTKEHKRIKGVSTSIGMGDILFEDKIVDSLGQYGRDLQLYLLAFYADPRGLNIRNRCAHGLLQKTDLSEAVTLRVVHTLVLLTFIS